MPNNFSKGPTERVSTIPDAPDSLAKESQKYPEDLNNPHLLIQAEIKELRGKHPLISAKLWTVLGEILGRQFINAHEVLWDLQGRKSRPDLALTYFEERLKVGRDKAMAERAAAMTSPMLGAKLGRMSTPASTTSLPATGKPNPVAGLRSRVHTLLGGTIADPKTMPERRSVSSSNLDATDPYKPKK